MIELTQEQARELAQAGGRPATLVDPTTRTAYVLLRQEEYDHLVDGYDDGPWTDEERDVLAAEVDALLDDDMAIEDPK